MGRILVNSALFDKTKKKTCIEKKETRFIEPSKWIGIKEETVISYRENYLRVVEFRNPEWIPCAMGFLPAVWKKYRERLEKIVLDHPLIFPGYKKGDKDFDEMPPGFKMGYFRDNWGCLWHTIKEGAEGRVVQHPLTDWKALDTYQPPDFLTKTDRGERNWDEVKRSIEEQKKKGLLTQGSGGELFTRLYYLRGFENLMIDIATDDPHLPRLIDMLFNYELGLVKKWLKIGVDKISFHSDIGTQRGLMISPAKFRRYLKPVFKKLFMTCRKADTHVDFSSDGCLLEIIDDLRECGVSIHDPQIRANTLGGIARVYKGKICINLDLDRQLFPFASPQEIRNHIWEAVAKLNSKQGGLLLLAQIGPDVPLENIEMICEIFEEVMSKKKL